MLVDPKTGDIIAATQRPTYNSTTKREGINVQWNNLLMDKLLSLVLMKVLALAAAINESLLIQMKIQIRSSKIIPI